LDDKKIPVNISSTNIFLRGTLIAVIITIPSLTAFFIGWYIIDDLIIAAIIGVVVHFISMIFILKISKRLFASKT
jgi:preprotein translocase subunit SecF